MVIQDRIYGNTSIDEPILTDLISSTAIQRLKGISQYGIPQKYYSFPGFSRFEHSLGTMLLLKKLGAGTLEQIAGLLHDVNHTAFSHLTDWVWGDRLVEDRQDNLFMDYLEKSEEFNEIFAKHRLDIKPFYDLHSFPLLEQDSPDICADRLDYSLREFKLWVKPSLVEPCIDGLIITENRIVFNRVGIAKEFSYAYLRCQMEHWGGLEAVYKFHKLSGILKQALDKKIISKEDLMQDDEFVLSKMEYSEDENIIKQLNELKDDPRLHPIGIIQHKKFRHVDPLTLDKGSVKRLSEIDTGFKKYLLEQKNINNKGIYI